MSCVETFDFQNLVRGEGLCGWSFDLIWKHNLITDVALEQTLVNYLICYDPKRNREWDLNRKEKICWTANYVIFFFKLLDYFALLHYLRTTAVYLLYLCSDKIFPLFRALSWCWLTLGGFTPGITSVELIMAWAVALSGRLSSSMFCVSKVFNSRNCSK